MAKMALNNFLSLLEQKQCSQAALYYGGDYKVLKSMNIQDNSDSNTELWQNFCTVNGGICLPFKIVNQQNMNEKEFKFTVQYFNEDGSLFATEGCPCRGGGQGSFAFRVKKQGEQFLVMDLPPYQK